MTRYLFGPVDPGYAARFLAGPRGRGECRTFSVRDPADQRVGPDATWADLAARLPAGWEPDFVALWLPYSGVPPGLWDAPVPLVGLAPDWHLLWHPYRATLPRCDLVITDRPGVDALARAGLGHARAANLFGLPGDWPPDEPLPPDDARDVDVLFVGNAQPAVTRYRAAWLARLARLAGRHKVVVRANVFGADYRSLMRRAKLVFNHSSRGEMNHRAAEAVAAGAVLLQEADCAEVADYLTPGEDYAPYTDADFEAVVEGLLADPARRREVAARARAKLPGLTFDSLWAGVVGRVAAGLDGLKEKAARRAADPRPWTTAELGWAALGGEPPARLLARAESDPHAAVFLGALLPDPAAAAGWSARAAALGVESPVLRLDQALALDRLGHHQDAAAAAGQALRLLDRAGGWSGLDEALPQYPPGFDLARVAWERAGWDPYAGPHSKRDLVRWRAHALLAALTGDPHHHEAAALARPDLPPARAALGCALARAGRAAEAVGHLRAAVDADPFDRPAARALAQALADALDPAGRAALLRDRQLLHAAAPDLVPAEDWFAEAPPSGGELASVIVLCCNELDYTRLCLESVLKHTRPPYELVLVDNGSTDGTRAYLESLKTRPGPERVAVVRSETNLGYPGGVNRGLAEARGRYLVLLNNDTVVTPLWLDGLVRAALSDWPKVGLAGAVTNYAGGPQQVEAGYADLSGIDGFAAARRCRSGGRVEDAARLTGFCLLVRREVFEAVGGLDERFGPGFFDDDDLCLRATKAGFRLVIAPDVYVHHFGSRTFAGLGIDAQAQLRENLGRFADKWGPDAARGYRLPDGTPVLPPPAPAAPASDPHPAAPASDPHPAAEVAAPIVVTSHAVGVTVPARPRGRPRVSLTMIVKNEEDNLPACLGPLRELVDEMVVVDTGSSDRTREVARGLGAKVSEFAWVDSFSAARNAALERASGDWVFWTDADDRLDPENARRLAALFASLGWGNEAYSMKCVCVADGQGGGETAVDHVRLFRSDPRHRWEYRVHEQILPSLRRTGADVRWSDVRVRHVGYVDPALRGRKLDRDLRLLKLEEAEQPGDPFTLFNLSAVFNELGDHKAALAAAEASLARSHPRDSIVRKLHATAARCRQRLGDPAGALAACRRGRRSYPDDAELLFVEAGLLKEAGRLDEAEAALKRLIGGREGQHFASVAAGLRGYLARHALAGVYVAQARRAEAEAEWQKALAEEPGYVPALVGLAHLYQARGDQAAVGRLLAALRSLGPVGAAEAEAVTGRTTG